ncbi:endoplasmic reticulum lectin 1-like protein, partial [Leptotrombidium deliense]
LDINCYAIGKSPSKPKGVAQFEPESKQNRLESLFDKKSNVIDISDIAKFKFDLHIDEHGIQLKPVTNEKPKLNYDSKTLRSFLNGEFCLRGGTGWWKYEFCYGKKVEQYHEERVGQRTAISLGKWKKDDHIRWLQQNPNKKPKKGKTPKQVSHFYGNGDSCDLTGKPRQVEVKLKCRFVEGQPESIALFLSEPKPCDYVLGIESPLVCQLLSTADENGLFSLPEEEKPLESL